MDNFEEQISQARLNVEEAESRFGKNALEVSYKLDELVLILRSNGRTLEAANTAARARVIRTACFTQESHAQDGKYGDASSVSREKVLSASGWAKKLHQLALISAAAILLIVALVPTPTANMHLFKDVVGSGAAASLLQLLLYPVKVLPRIAKFAIVLVGSGLIWMLLGGQPTELSLHKH